MYSVCGGRAMVLTATLCFPLIAIAKKPPVYRTGLTVMVSPDSIPDDSAPDIGAQSCGRGGGFRCTGGRIKHSTGHKQSCLRKQVGRAGTEGELNPLFFGLGEPTGRKDLHAPIFVFILQGTGFDLRLGAELFGIQGQLGQQRVEAETRVMGRWLTDHALSTSCTAVTNSAARRTWRCAILWLTPARP